MSSTPTCSIGTFRGRVCPFATPVSVKPSSHLNWAIFGAQAEVQEKLGQGNKQLSCESAYSTRPELQAKHDKNLGIALF